MYSPSSVFRRQAREALQNHWQTGLLIALIVNLPSLLVQAVSAFTNNDLLTRVQQIVLLSAQEGTLSQDTLLASLDSLVRETGIWVMQGAGLLAWLITPFLSLGMIHWLLLRLRKEEGPVATVFSRGRIFFRATGLQLFTTLKIALWALPGAAVMALSLLPIYQARPATLQEANNLIRVSTGLTYLGAAAMAIPGIMAALRYAMAEILLADQPDTRITECVRESKRLMKGMKGALFALELSCLLWQLAVLVVSTLLEGLFGGVPSLMFQMLGSLAVSLYLQASVCAFSEDIRAQRLRHPHEETIKEESSDAQL